MVSIRYSRLSAGDVVNIEYVKWVKSRLPVAFLRQQLVLVSLVIASALLLILTAFFAPDVEYDLVKNVSREFQYGVVVDCGSSGSRAHIFRWRPESVIAHIELVRDITTHEPLNKHIMPGLSTLRDTPDKASDYMEPIMEFVSASVPSERHLDTPIYFMATAGMRLLEESIQKKILTDITRDLRAKFNFPKIKSQVISGAQEAVYSWLSLNVNKRLTGPITGPITYGMIEMGGASTQVAFELNEDLENELTKKITDTNSLSVFKSEQIVLNLGPSNSVKLFATTFLGLGVNSARISAIDVLSRDYLNSTDNTESDLIKFGASLKDPCLTSGSSEIVLRPISLVQKPGSPIGSEIKQSEGSFKVRLEGTGDLLSCTHLLERTLKMLKAEKLNCFDSKTPCSLDLLGSNFIPYSQYHFMGLSEMFYTTDEMMNSAGSFDRKKILHETRRICSTQYNQLLEKYSHSGVTHQDRILYECFKASWMLTLLHDSGLKMPVDYGNFTTIQRLENEEIDWTIGAIIAEVALNKFNAHMMI